MKIKPQKHNALNEQDRLELARLLIKAGYKVSIGTEKNGNKAAVPYVEYEEVKRDADT